MIRLMSLWLISGAGTYDEFLDTNAADVLRLIRARVSS